MEFHGIDVLISQPAPCTTPTHVILTQLTSWVHDDSWMASLGYFISIILPDSLQHAERTRREVSDDRDARDPDRETGRRLLALLLQHLSG